MAEEDPNLDDEAEGGEERSSNRTFLILAGVLGGGFLLILALIAGLAFFWLPNQRREAEAG
ncbi:MAG: hypothetical protein JNL73_12160, partial [Anaerolineales bacterium]|nr:hypothetical protein [Anaerolineales bacterium]